MRISISDISKSHIGRKCTFSGLVRTDEALESNVKNRRLLQFGKEEIDESRVELPPGDNLGAGGLDRCLFSHLQKNWTRLLTKSNVGIVHRKRSVVMGHF